MEEEKKSAAASWNWMDVLGAAQAHAQVIVEKAQVIAEKASQDAAVLVQKANEIAQNYDIEAAKRSILSVTDTAISGIEPSKSSVSISRTLDLVYITENIMSMAFPYDFKQTGVVENGNDIRVVSRYLNRKHAGHFMVWNISEESYDYSLFENQVLEYKFPGHPAPPLGLLFKICTSIESWLDADERNVAVVHCLTGKGRTAALISCILTWIGEFGSPMEALQYVSDRKSLSLEHLTIPSQRRYVQYFSNMLDGVRPRPEPLLLRRVIMNSIPKFGKFTVVNNDKEQIVEGCCPYVQFFKCGKLIATATPPSTEEVDPQSAALGGSVGGSELKQSGNTKKSIKLKWINAEEGSVQFPVDCALQGDILLRFRHASASGARASMFRAAFHTGYVPYGVLRLYKAQLDGANEDDRFPDDFFIDLIFAPIEIAPDTPADMSSAAGSEEGASKGQAPILAVGVPTDSGLVIDASSTDRYEQSIHRDTRFWDTVAARKQKAKKRRARKFVSSAHEQFSIGEEEQRTWRSTAGAYDDTDTEFTVGKSNPKKNKSAAALDDEADAALLNLAQLSDEELILQLSSEHNKSTAVEQVQVKKADSSTNLLSSAIGFLTDSSTKNEDAGTVSKSASVEKNDDVLEELEKELQEAAPIEPAASNSDSPQGTMPEPSPQVVEGKRSAAVSPVPSGPAAIAAEVKKEVARAASPLKPREPPAAIAPESSLVTPAKSTSSSAVPTEIEAPLASASTAVTPAQQDITPSVPKAQHDDLDDLEELERFLKSMNSS